MGKHPAPCLGLSCVLRVREAVGTVHAQLRTEPQIPEELLFLTTQSTDWLCYVNIKSFALNLYLQNLLEAILLNKGCVHSSFKRAFKNTILNVIRRVCKPLNNSRAEPSHSWFLNKWSLHFQQGFLTAAQNINRKWNAIIGARGAWMNIRECIPNDTSANCLCHRF